MEVAVKKINMQNLTKKIIKIKTLDKFFGFDIIIFINLTVFWLARAGRQFFYL